MITEEKPKETKFQGAMGLDAILAAVSGKDKKETPAVEVKKPEPVKKEEEKTPEPPVEKTVVEEKPAEPVKKEEPKPQVPQQETEAYKTAKRLISMGVIEDFSIQTSDEDEEGTLISEFTQMSDDQLDEIVKISKQEKDTEISDKYISKEGLKEHQLKVIEILKNGGDLSQIAKSPDDAMKRPFEGFDMDNKERQMDVLYTDLVHGKKLSHEKAIRLIEISNQDGKLAEEAQEVFDIYRKNHADFIERKLQEQKKQKEFKELNYKENKKSLIEKLKEAGLKETAYKKVATEYAKRNDNGEYALIDKLKAALEKPDENYELILHLSDAKLFNDTYSIKSAQDAQRKIVRLATGASSKGNKQTVRTNAKVEETPWTSFADQFNQNLKRE